MITVNEQNQAKLTAAFFDVDGVATVPATLEYRIDDQASGTQVKDWTAVTELGTTVEIPLTSVDNSMVDPRAPNERRVVTLRADYEGSGDVALTTGEYTYQVRNLRFIS